MTLTIRLDEAAGEPIISAQALIMVTDSAGAGVPGLTLTGGTGLRSDMIFAQYEATQQYASSPIPNARYRSLFVPAPIQDPQPLINGILMTAVLNIPAGLPLGNYPISFVGAGTPGGSDATDTFVSVWVNEWHFTTENQNPGALQNGAMSVLNVPEPVSGLLLLCGLFALQRRSLARG